MFWCLSCSITGELRKYPAFWTLDEIMDIIRGIPSTRPFCEKLEHIPDFEKFLGNMDPAAPLVEGVKNMTKENYNIKIFANQGVNEVVPTQPSLRPTPFAPPHDRALAERPPTSCAMFVCLFACSAAWAAERCATTQCRPCTCIVCWRPHGAQSHGRRLPLETSRV